jgi:hypothetical protein
MAALSMESFLRLDFRFERIRIPINDGFNSQLPLFIIFSVSTINTIALRATTLTKGEAVTIQLQALGFLAIASVSTSCALDS